MIKISNIKNTKIKIDKNRLRPIDADLQLPDTRKFRKHTGWKPQIKFDQTMHDLLDYWRDKLRYGPFINR